MDKKKQAFPDANVRLKYMSLISQFAFVTERKQVTFLVCEKNSI